jgi:formate/nitrite transporter FocA (FNT family)
MINPILGALFFSFGLLTVIKLSTPLYTGRVGFYQNKTLIDILLGNLAGITITTLIYMCANPDFCNALVETAAIKFSKTFLQMFCCGFLCGMLIHFAVKAKDSIITILAITIFILIGSEHCIADFPFLLANFNLTNLLKWGLIVLGNSLGAICIEFLTENKNEICSDNSK